MIIPEIFELSIWRQVTFQNSMKLHCVLVEVKWGNICKLCSKTPLTFVQHVVASYGNISQSNVKYLQSEFKDILQWFRMVDWVKYQLMARLIYQRLILPPYTNYSIYQQYKSIGLFQISCHSELKGLLLFVHTYSVRVSMI